MSYFVPICVIALIVYALIKKVHVYDAFVEGAAGAAPMLLRIMPYIAAMLVAIGVLRACGLIDDFAKWIGPTLEKIGLPAQVVPMILLRPFSGSAVVALLSDVFKSSGPDSFAGYLGSILLGSSETIFYTLALYFGSAKITKSRYTVPVALISMAAGAAASVIVAHLMWRPC